MSRPERNLARLYLALLIAQAARRSPLCRAAAPRPSAPKSQVGFVPRDTSRARARGTTRLSSRLKPRGLITSGNKPREQGNIGRLAPSTRHARRPLTGPVGHISRSPIIASRRSTRLRLLLTGSIAMTMYQKPPATMVRNFFSSRLIHPQTRSSNTRA